MPIGGRPLVDATCLLGGTRAGTHPSRDMRRATLINGIQRLSSAGRWAEFGASLGAIPEVSAECLQTGVLRVIGDGARTTSCAVGGGEIPLGAGSMNGCRE